MPISGRILHLYIFLAAACASEKFEKAEHALGASHIDVDYTDYTDYQPNSPYDLRNPIQKEDHNVMSATGTVLLMRNAPLINHDGFVSFPVIKHCERFNCEGFDRSFTKFKDDYIIDIKRSGTGAFISQDIILTATHLFPDIDNITNAYCLMDLGRVPNEEPRLEPCGERTCLKIEAQYILTIITKPLHHGGTNDLKNSDWAVLRLSPLGSTPIPKHATFKISNAQQYPKTKIIVPAHPRMLPLKIGNGSTVTPGSRTLAMTGYYDTAGGASGAPLLLADDPTTLVGVNRGFDHPEYILDTDQFRQAVCNLSASNSNCPTQPATPAIQFCDVIQNQNHRGVTTSCQ